MPARPTPPPPGGLIQLHWIELDSAPAPWETLSPEEQARADRFHFPHDRHRYIACRAALRALLGEALGVSPEAVALTYGPQGKPESQLAFNVSHSGPCGVIALGGYQPLGIDLEALRTDFEPLQLGRTVFTEAELAALAAQPEDQRHAAFYSIWTRKEALIKAEGGGFSSPLLKRTVWPDPEPWIAEHYTLQTLESGVGAGYAAALAVAKKDARQLVPGD